MSIEIQNEVQTENTIVVFNNKVIEIYNLGIHYAFQVGNTFKSGFISEQKAIEAAKTFILNKVNS